MDAPVESDKTPLTVIFRDVPDCTAEHLGDVLLNNADARRALMLFLQDSGLLFVKEGTTWDVSHVQIQPPVRPLKNSENRL